MTFDSDYPKIANRTMARKLAAGEAIDVSRCEKTPEGYYILEDFNDGMDYCDALLERWMWSIGRRKSDGALLASDTAIFYRNPDFVCLVCLWLR